MTEFDEYQGQRQDNERQCGTAAHGARIGRAMPISGPGLFTALRPDTVTGHNRDIGYRLIL